MIRTVLAVLVGVALLATALPALEDARVQSTHEEFESMATEVTRTAAELESGSTAVTDRELAARTTIRLGLPTGFDSAPIRTAAIGCPSAVLDVEQADPGGCNAALVYRLRGGDATVRRFPGVDVRALNGPIRLSGSPGRFRLRYVRVGNASVVELVDVDSVGTET
ncbi:MAG: hypothetical protein ABEH81_11130 [Halopenitus sp.]